MQKALLLITAFLSLMIFTTDAQEITTGNAFRVVLLGDYQCNECSWTSSDSSVTIIKACVPDFSSQQLSWTVDELVIKPLQGEGYSYPGMCILNTGQLDVILGVPSARVIENIDNIRNKLRSRNIGFAVMAPLSFSSPSDFNKELTKLSDELKHYCDSTGTGFIDPNPVLSPDGILSEKYTRDEFLINEPGCEHWGKIVNDFISRYDKIQ